MNEGGDKALWISMGFLIYPILNHIFDSSSHLFFFLLFLVIELYDYRHFPLLHPKLFQYCFTSIEFVLQTLLPSKLNTQCSSSFQCSWQISSELLIKLI